MSKSEVKYYTRRVYSKCIIKDFRHVTYVVVDMLAYEKFWITSIDLDDVW